MPCFSPLASEVPTLPLDEATGTDRLRRPPRLATSWEELDLGMLDAEGVALPGGWYPPEDRLERIELGHARRLVDRVH
jgi:hypothetical protein